MGLISREGANYERTHKKVIAKNNLKKNEQQNKTTRISVDRACGDRDTDNIAGGSGRGSYA